MKRSDIIFVAIYLVLISLVAGAVYAQTTGGIAGWGANQYGQCSVPAPNGDFVYVRAGRYHSLGLKADSTIVVWGDNSNGQLNIPSPNEGFVAVDVGGWHNLALRSDSTIAAWGYNNYGQCSVPAPNGGFIAVAAGNFHSLGLKADGSIVAWGRNNEGQCNVPAPNSGFIAIAGGASHCLGLKSDGSIVAWGWNNYGECNVPAPNSGFVAMAAYMHSLGLKSDGTIVAWGANYQGQCNVPSPNENFIAVAAGYEHSLGLKSDGSIVAWGRNNNGQCNVPTPNTGFIGLDGGEYHSVGLKDDPICSVFPTALAFGTVFVDAYEDTTFVIRNTGYGSLEGSVGETCDHFSIVSGEGAYTIYSGDSLMVTVRYEPEAEGPHLCDVETGTECSSVSCSGTGLGPICSVEPLSLDFGSVTIGHHEDLGFILTNPGGGRLLGSIEAACGYFDIVAGAGAYDLGHDDSVLVTVRFEPLTTDAAACTISVGTGCDSVVCSGTGDRVPHIYAIRDVPGDQGGFLNLAWDASPGDNIAEHLITRYTVWRAIDPVGSGLSSVDPLSFILSVSDMPEDAPVGEVVRIEQLGSATYYWKLISSVDAYFLEGYSEVVPTLFDSTEVCDEYHYVQVIAHTGDPYTFWVSPPDSGRSVDNLAPAPPLGLSGEQSFEPIGLTLTWSPNGEADLAGYDIYRGLSPDFVPGAGNLVASIPDTLYLDTDWRWDAGYYYKVAAVDVHGNRSAPALLAPDGVTGGETPGAPAATFLGQNYPNPFNPLTRIAFGLSSPAHVSLRVYDAAGRLVRVLINEPRTQARYHEVWDGRNDGGDMVSSGIYFYRLEAGSFVQTRKMVLLR